MQCGKVSILDEPTNFRSRFGSLLDIAEVVIEPVLNKTSFGIEKYTNIPVTALPLPKRAPATLLPVQNVSQK